MKRLLMIIIAFILALLFMSCNGTTTLPTTDSVTTVLTSGDSTTLAPTTIISTEDEELSIALNPGVDTVEVGTEFIDAGATAFYESTELTVTVSETTVDIDTVGLYYIMYQATHDEQTIEIIRFVIVIDSTPPVVSLNPGIDTIKVGDEWIDAGITAEDNYDETVSVTVLGEVDTDTVGTYTITYLAFDEMGNTTTIRRIVDVIA